MVSAVDIMKSQRKAFKLVLSAKFEKWKSFIGDIHLMLWFSVDDGLMQQNQLENVTYCMTYIYA